MKNILRFTLLLLLPIYNGVANANPQDYTVSNLSKNTFRWCQFVANRTQGKPVSEKIAKRLKKAVLADNLVDENEKKLIQILTKRNYSKITIGAKKSLTFKPNDIVFTNAISDKAIEAIKGIVVIQYEDPLLAKWHSGLDGYRELLKIYQSSVAGKDKVSLFYVALITDHWSRSTWKDGYDVLKKFISLEKSKINKLNGVNYRFARKFLYESILKADKAVDNSAGRIPDPIYQDLKPK